MKRNNIDIREAIKEAGLFYWEVAEKLGLNDGNFSRLLRKELSEESKEEIKQVISQLRKERNCNVQS